MERIDKILKHDLFLECVDKNYKAEADRPFCRHDMGHFLDVARIGCMINQEEQLGLEKEWIYAAALLHDIGRHIQYEDGTPHELASVRIAPKILEDCGFDKKETSDILSAIASHRDKSAAAERNLTGVLYRADKASRPCFACEARKACNWKEDKKNLHIIY
ncbi:MAG: HD domain-containing protein [Roseburia sp.]|nr:HD domain-containing protein [Roseburia sp.]